MKKKLISFVLCLLMVVPLVLTSCSKSGATDTSQENATRPYKTLSFWIITEEDTTPAAAQAMQNAFNEVCKNKYSTQVQFTFCTEKEYREKLLNRLADAADEVKRQQEAADKAKKEAEELKKQGITQPATKAPTTTISDDPNNDNNYPELGAGQVDIVLINSKSLYEELAGAGMLLSLNKQLSTTYNGINAHVYPEIMKLASIDGNKYAIPNQMVIGEYTYLLVNKKLAEKYHYDASSIPAMILPASIPSYIRWPVGKTVRRLRRFFPLSHILRSSSGLL